ncbi:MAG: cyclodeaminase/cyclohydrolase family protein [Lachnospiraceae bacterium]|jgi:formiminotetrahydrofolate cyclodeaminase|nr:cyclodeaminase/cyclohydrolase family protein [Lachnospiraceae bacterium]
MKDMTLEAFCALTESNEPAPGGGSVAALAGALAAALAGMVANLTMGREKYADVEDEMKVMEASASALSKELLDGILKDSESFNVYMDALKLPKGTDEEKAARREAMQEGLKAAAIVPLENAKLAYEAMDYAELAVKKGNQNAVTDGKTAMMMARTAVLAAGYNVKINLESIKDEEFVAKMRTEIENIEENAIRREKELLGL